MEIKISKCPYCNSLSGFQVESKCRGTFFRCIDFDNTEIESSYGENMTYGKEGIPVCNNCLKPLGRWIKDGDL